MHRLAGASASRTPSRRPRRPAGTSPAGRAAPTQRPRRAADLLGDRRLSSHARPARSGLYGITLTATFEQDDATPPTITYDGKTPAPNANGWNNSTVTATWDCADSGSGPVSPTVTQTLSSEGANQAVTGTCADNNGNSVDGRRGHGLDRRDGTDGDGHPERCAECEWMDQRAVHGHVGRLGFAVRYRLLLSASSLLGSDTATGSLSGTAPTRPGTSATGSFSFKYDATPPVIQLVSRTAANGNGWNKTAVTVTWSCTDCDVGRRRRDGHADTEHRRRRPVGDRHVHRQRGQHRERHRLEHRHRHDASDGDRNARPRPERERLVQGAVHGHLGCDGCAVGRCHVRRRDDVQRAGRFGRIAERLVHGCRGEHRLGDLRLFVRRDGADHLADGPHAANGAGWNKTPVTLTWSCSDGTGSGPTAASVDAHAVDRRSEPVVDRNVHRPRREHGERSPERHRHRPDRAVVTADPSAAANSNGWHTAAFTVAWNGSDTGGSGIASCSSDSSVGRRDGRRGACREHAPTSRATARRRPTPTSSTRRLRRSLPSDITATGTNAGLSRVVLSRTCPRPTTSERRRSPARRPRRTPSRPGSRRRSRAPRRTTRAIRRPRHSTCRSPAHRISRVAASTAEVRARRHVDTLTLVAQNAGLQATSGTVTVVDTLPAGLTASAISGTGWTCTLATRHVRAAMPWRRSTYPAITLTVSVASGAADSITNSATVSGGPSHGAAGNDTATDDRARNAGGPGSTPPTTPAAREQGP